MFLTNPLPGGGGDTPRTVNKCVPGVGRGSGSQICPEGRGSLTPCVS